MEGGKRCVRRGRRRCRLLPLSLVAALPRRCAARRAVLRCSSRRSTGPPTNFPQAVRAARAGQRRQHALPAHGGLGLPGGGAALRHPRAAPRLRRRPAARGRAGGARAPAGLRAAAGQARVAGLEAEALAGAAAPTPLPGSRRARSRPLARTPVVLLLARPLALLAGRPAVGRASRAGGDAGAGFRPRGAPPGPRRRLLRQVCRWAGGAAACGPPRHAVHYSAVMDCAAAMHATACRQAPAPCRPALDA